MTATTRHMTAFADNSVDWSRPQASERADYIPRWDGERFIVPLLRRYIESRLGVLVANNRVNATVLDVGCGRQPFRSLVEASGAEYVSLDAQQNTDGTVDYVAPIDGDLPSGLLSRDPFSLVICTEVLEHVADWNGAFSNLQRLSAPGTAVLVTCPFFYPLHGEPYDFWRPTIHALSHFAVRYGMRMEEIVKLGDAWDVLGTLMGASSILLGNWSLSSRILHACARCCRRAALSAVAHGSALRRVQLTEKLYLANAAVLRVI
jgi:hypothetical protein